MTFNIDRALEKLIKCSIGTGKEHCNRPVTFCELNAILTSGREEDINAECMKSLQMQIDKLERRVSQLEGKKSSWGCTHNFEVGECPLPDCANKPSEPEKPDYVGCQNCEPDHDSCESCIVPPINGKPSSTVTNEEIIDALEDCFAQGCSDNNYKDERYDHMCISAYENAQEILIRLGRIDPKKCVRTL